MSTKYTTTDLYVALGATPTIFQNKTHYVSNSAITVNGVKYMVAGIMQASDGQRLGNDLNLKLTTDKKTLIKKIIESLLNDKYTEQVAVDYEGYTDDSSSPFNFSHFVTVKNQPHPYSLFLRHLLETLA